MLPPAPAAPARKPTLGDYYPALVKAQGVEKSSLLSLESISWQDIESTDAHTLEAALVAWLFSEPVPGLCNLRWLPGNAPEQDGSWPLCTAVEIPPPNKCLAYNVGVGNLPKYDEAFPNELGCQARAFDPTIKAPSYPGGVIFHPVGLSGENHLTGSDGNKMKVGTLSALMGLNNEQGRRLLVLKVDCEGCEWDAFPQMLRDQGPDALKDIDMVMFEIHLGWQQYNPKKAMALVALLHNQGFRMYWRHFNPWSLAGGGTGSLLKHIRDMYGEKLASELDATEENFLRLGREYKTYMKEYQQHWQRHVSPGNVFCCFEMAFVREGAISTPAGGARLLSRPSDKDAPCPSAA